MASNDIYVANESFSTTFEGTPITVRKNETRVRAGHPLLKKFPGLFDPMKVHYDIEQATSAPAERRGAPTSPPASPRSARSAPETPAKDADASNDAPATSEAQSASSGDEATKAE